MRTSKQQGPLARTTRSGVRIRAALTLALAGGCGSLEPTPESGRAEATLLEREPLTVVPNEAAADAPPGCDGLLLGDEEFVVTDDGALLALDHEGTPICVDDSEAIRDALSAIARGDEADALCARYLATLAQNGIASPGSDHSGDPDPEPSMGRSGMQQYSRMQQAR